MKAFDLNIYLIGAMGTGKTTIGKQLAKKLHLKFYDLDLEIEQRTGASVNLIFEIEGEAGFRKRETALLKELSSNHSVVIATGGGTVVEAINRELIKKTGFCIYLKTSVEKQFERLIYDKKRPLLLNTEDRYQKLQELHQQREPLYLELADAICEPKTNQNATIITNQIIKILNQHQKHDNA